MCTHLTTALCFSPPPLPLYPSFSTHPGPQTIWSEAGYEEVECQSLLGDLLNKLKMTCAAELAAEQQVCVHVCVHMCARGAVS